MTGTDTEQGLSGRIDIPQAQCIIEQQHGRIHAFQNTGVYIDLVHHHRDHAKAGAKTKPNTPSLVRSQAISLLLGIKAKKLQVTWDTNAQKVTLAPERDFNPAESTRDNITLADENAP